MRLYKQRLTQLKPRLTISNTVLLIICLMYLILYVDRVSTAAPLIKADLNLTNTQLGLAFSAFAYPYAMFQLIGGYFGDRFGPRLTLCVCSLIVCVATAVTGLLGGFASLFAARLALGADSDEVARAFRNDITRGSEMMSPGC